MNSHAQIAKMPLQSMNQSFMDNLEKARRINNPMAYAAPMNKTNNAPALPAATAAAPSVVHPATPREVPFYPFTPDFPTWEGDAAFTGSDYLLLNKPKDKTDGKDPLKDPAKPTVFLTPRVIKEVQYIVDKADGEVAWMFLSKQIAPKSRTYLIYDYFLADQDASGAHVSLDMEDMARYTNYLKETYPEQWPDGNIAQDLHHGHSHVSMPVVWSGTDIKQQESKDELGFQNDYRFFLVFNKHKEVYASMVVYSPVFFRVDDIHVGIYTGDGTTQNVELTRQRKKELDTIMAALVKKPTYTYYSRYNPNYNYGYNFAPDYGNRWPATQGRLDRFRNRFADSPSPNTPAQKYDGVDMWGEDGIYGSNYLYGEEYENFEELPDREAPGTDAIAGVQSICMEEITNYYTTIAQVDDQHPTTTEKYRQTIIKKAMELEEFQELYAIEFFTVDPKSKMAALTAELVIGYLVDVSEEFTFGDGVIDNETGDELGLVELLPEIIECLMQLMMDLEVASSQPMLAEMINIGDELADKAGAAYQDGILYQALERSI